MTQTDRDRLVALKKAKDRKITQRQAAEELKLSERHVRRLKAAAVPNVPNPAVAAERRKYLECRRTALFYQSNSVGVAVKPVGKPDALVGHVRFDERGRETTGWLRSPV